MAHSEYDLIKKNNGEGFARILRDANVLDIPDIVELVKYVGRHTPDNLVLDLAHYLQAVKQEIIDTQQAAATVNPDTDPFELLHQAGYTYAEYADTLTKQNAIKKYFTSREELCTFRDPERYKNFYIINAVRGDADKVKRSDKPERQDAYGTSVISIQISKQGGFISIKNRYNHSVPYSDSTFDSNPDNIIPGLSNAIKKYFNVQFTITTAGVPGDFIRVGNHLVRYAMEYEGIFYGDSFYVYNGHIYEINKSTQVMMDNFILDIPNRHITSIPEKVLLGLTQKDGFVPVMNNEIANRRLTVRGQFPNQSIWADDVCLIELKNSQIVTVNLPNTTKIPDYFMQLNTEMTSLVANNVTYIGDVFCTRNHDLKSISINNVTEIGNYFLARNHAISSFFGPKIEKIGHCFMASAQSLRFLYLPMVKTVGPRFAYECKKLVTCITPNLTMGDTYFLTGCPKLRFLCAPMVREFKYDTLCDTKISSLCMPHLTDGGTYLLYHNCGMKYFYAPRFAQMVNDMPNKKKFELINKIVLDTLKKTNNIPDDTIWQFIVKNTFLRRFRKQK